MSGKPGLLKPIGMLLLDREVNQFTKKFYKMYGKPRSTYVVAWPESRNWPELETIGEKYKVRAIIQPKEYWKLKNKQDSDFFVVSRGGASFFSGGLAYIPPLWKWMLLGLNSIPKTISLKHETGTAISEKLYLTGANLPVKQPEKIVFNANLEPQERLTKKIYDFVYRKKLSKFAHKAVLEPKARAPFVKKQQVLVDGRPIVGFLKKHKRIFVKTQDTHAGHGIVVLSLDNDGRIYASLPDKKNEILVGNQKNAYKKIPRFIQKFAKQNKSNYTIIEQEIKGELLDADKKTEIRIILEDNNYQRKKHEKGKSTILGDYAKIGPPGKHLGNISQGGSGMKTIDLLKILYRQRFPDLDEKRMMKKVRCTYSSFRNAAVQASNYFQAVHTTLYKPSETLKPRFYSVDLMPEFNEKTGLIEPVLMEMHHQAAEHVIGMDGLAAANPATHGRIAEKMKKHSLNQLEYLLSKHADRPSVVSMRV